MNTHHLMKRVADALWEAFSDCPQPELLGDLIVVALPDGRLEVAIRLLT